MPFNILFTPPLLNFVIYCYIIDLTKKESEVITIEWFSYAVAVILFLSSIISPWLINKSNNKHQLRLKKLEMYETAKRNSLIEFIKCAQLVAYNPTNPEIVLKYQTAFNSLFVYFPNIKLDIIYPFEEYRAKLANNDNAEDYQFASHTLTNIVQELSKQIDKQ